MYLRNIHLHNNSFLYSEMQMPQFKMGFYLKAVFPSRNLGLMRISRSRFKQSKNLFIHPTNLRFAEFCKFLGDFWVYLGGDFFFLNGLVK